ncbi:MAG TPA: DUF2334 domain-containing protein [Actinomycetota bacterium]|jgi:predicted deacetylase|nr:DUF2334 domain-containing protein [Actinomycetota bacterium]
MKPTYLIRFDDACPTMNWSVWSRVERIVSSVGVRPLISVIPDNQDERLRFDSPRGDFWDGVRAWQANGWAIGVHGYQHRTLPHRNAHWNWRDRTEFAGLTYDEQSAKVRAALAIFEREGVRANAWVAPWHSFDATTLEVVRNEGISVICDGLARYPFVDDTGMLWVPQQLWWFRPRASGVWTVCLHPNRWTDERLDAFGIELAKVARRVTDLQAVVHRYQDRRRDLWDRWFQAQRRARMRFRGPSEVPSLEGRS